MHRITAAVMGTITALVLLFSYRTSAPPTTTAATSEDDPGTASDTTAGSSVTPSATPSATHASKKKASASPSAAPTTSAGASGTYTGDSVQTRYGPVQVRVTVQGGTLTDVRAVKYPNSSRHDQQVNSRAIPILNSEALSARSAKIDAVSGATITSGAYVQSLQSALDAVHA